MPNHVANIIRVDFRSKEDKESFIKRYFSPGEAPMPDLNENVYFDFDLVIPKPIYIYTGSLGQKEREIYGEHNWYDWNIKNWDTKCGAYQCWIDEYETNPLRLVFGFQTAWSPSEIIFLELCKQNPGVNILELQFAVESLYDGCVGTIVGSYNQDIGELVYDRRACNDESELENFGEGLWDDFVGYRNRFENDCEERYKQYKLENPMPLIVSIGPDLTHEAMMKRFNDYIGVKCMMNGLEEDANRAKISKANIEGRKELMLTSISMKGGKI